MTKIIAILFVSVLLVYYGGGKLEAYPAKTNGGHLGHSDKYNNNCESNSDCDANHFCFGKGRKKTCRLCFDCSTVQRKPVLAYDGVVCSTHQGECGECEDGLEARGGICFPGQSTSPLPPHIPISTAKFETLSDSNRANDNSRFGLYWRSDLLKILLPIMLVYCSFGVIAFRNYGRFQHAISPNTPHDSDQSIHDLPPEYQKQPAYNILDKYNETNGCAQVQGGIPLSGSSNDTTIHQENEVNSGNRGDETLTDQVQLEEDENYPQNRDEEASKPQNVPPSLSKANSILNERIGRMSLFTYTFASREREQLTGASTTTPPPPPEVEPQPEPENEEPNPEPAAPEIPIDDELLDNLHQHVPLLNPGEMNDHHEVDHRRVPDTDNNVNELVMADDDFSMYDFEGQFPSPPASPLPEVPDFAAQIAEEEDR